MLNDTLPARIDVRKLATKGATITASVPVSTLPRFVDLLSDPTGTVAVDLRFYIDDERIRRLDGQLQARVNVTCQRCLEAMPIVIDATCTLGIVWSEEDAKRLPAAIEPLIVGEELVDLCDVVAEELILSCPYVSYHSADDCNAPVGYTSAAPALSAHGATALPADDAECQHTVDTVECKNNGKRQHTVAGKDSKHQHNVERENPFKVLEQLKSGYSQSGNTKPGNTKPGNTKPATSGNIKPGP